MATRITTEFDENDKKFIEKAVTEAANNYWNENKSELNQKIFEQKKIVMELKKELKKRRKKLLIN